MAVAWSPQNHLGRLPDELILEIIEQPCLSVRDLISLARTSRRHYGTAVSLAYKKHVEHQHGFAIYWAIKNEERETLGRLVENGIDVNMHPKLDRHESDDVDLCRYICAVGELEPIERDEDHIIGGFTPLAWAASLGKDSMVEYLLEHGADIELKSARLCKCCCELLYYCAEPPLLELPTIPEDWMYCGDKWTSLHYAICNQHISTARLLIERGANVHSVSGDDRVTALHVATRWNVDELIDYLMDNDLAHINAQNTDGVTALHIAYISERVDLVEKYLDNGADINLAYEGKQVKQVPWTIFSMACVEGSFGRAIEYLRRGADPQFVLEIGWYEDPWTVMRIIYNGFPDDPEKFTPEDLEMRRTLEQEIIATGWPRPQDE